MSASDEAKPAGFDEAHAPADRSAAIEPPLSGYFSSVTSAGAAFDADGAAALTLHARVPFAQARLARLRLVARIPLLYLGLIVLVPLLAAFIRRRTDVACVRRHRHGAARDGVSR